MHSQCQSGQQQPTTAALTSAFRDLLEGFHHTFIILDALDECTEQDSLLGLIEEVVGWKLDKMHILATSRKEIVIKECLESLFVDQIDLHSALVDPDIGVLIRDRLRNDSGGTQVCLSIALRAAQSTSG